jgi:uncharacterized Tic20 family protein
VIAVLETLRAKLLLAILLLFPLVIGCYLVFFHRHAMKNMSMFDIVPPGKSALFDNINRTFYIVIGFILIFVGLKLFPLLQDLLQPEE